MAFTATCNEAWIVYSDRKLYCEPFFDVTLLNEVYMPPFDMSVLDQARILEAFGLGFGLVALFAWIGLTLKAALSPLK